MNSDLRELTEEAIKLVDFYDREYKEGMDHEQGYDFASSMRDVILDLIAALRERG